MPMERVTDRRWERQTDGTEIYLDECPCCKGEAKLAWGEGVGVSRAYVRCLACGLTTPPFESVAIAVGIWNTRPKEDSKTIANLLQDSTYFRLTMGSHWLTGDDQDGWHVYYLPEGKGTGELVYKTQSEAEAVCFLEERKKAEDA